MTVPFYVKRNGHKFNSNFICMQNSEFENLAFSEMTWGRGGFQALTERLQYIFNPFITENITGICHCCIEFGNKIYLNYLPTLQTKLLAVGAAFKGTYVPGQTGENLNGS